ncbi:hypothetical protein LSH36_23g10010 [Paralvinella palmiformis]|uniref:Caveolin n=1 Tax=Paralvinella palmiformis TaxID=53620 RepID=A0AAD9KA27_9ANNE|nr:hypothetical protein LSH36_23g10010 [Paralvinella palmiformis]
MDYEDIFNEPISYKTKGLGRFLYYGITRVFGGAFNYTQSTVYYILVMISGLILGFFWGVMFGVLVFFFNWFLHPLYKLIFLFLQLVAMLVRPGIRIFTDPVFESIALCYRNIKGTMDVNLHKWPADDSKADYTELSAVS